MAQRGTELPNPFISSDNFKPKTRRKISKNKALNEVYDSDGVVHSGVIGFEMLPELYDSQRFTKVYKQGWSIMSELSSSALRVLLYFISVMDYCDTVEFDIRKCTKFTGYKDKSHIYKAIKELKERSVIAETDSPRLYFLNPTMFFLGKDRLKLIR